MRKFIILIFVLLMSFNAFAMGFDVGTSKLDIYSSIRSGFFISSISGDNYEDMTTAKLNLQGNSRAGIKWNWANYFVQLEMGYSASTEDTRLRLLYGGIKSENWGTFQFGQMNSISDNSMYHFRKSDTDGGLVGVGGLLLVRRAGIRYGIKGLDVQLTSLDTDKSKFTALMPASAGYSSVRFKEILPKVELAYTLPMAPVKIAGAYAFFRADAVNSGSKVDAEVSAWHLTVSAHPKFDKFYINLSGFYSVNGGLYGMAKTNDNGTTYGKNLTPVLKNNNKGEFDDVSAYGIASSFGYQINPKVVAELGAGYQSASCDAWADDDNNMGIYGQVRIKPNKWFTITPEIAYLDFLTRSDGLDDVSTLLLGVQLRLDI